MADSRTIVISVDLKDNATGQVGGMKKSVADNLSALADKIAGHLGKTVLDSFNNMSLGH